MDDVMAKAEYIGDSLTKDETVIKKVLKR